MKTPGNSLLGSFDRDARQYFKELCSSDDSGYEPDDGSSDDSDYIGNDDSSDESGYIGHDDSGYDSSDRSGYDAGIESFDDGECSITELIQQNKSETLDHQLSSSTEKLSATSLNSHLLFSIRCAHLDCVKVLIKHGANMNATDDVGGDRVSPFYLAAYLSINYASPSDDQVRILGFLIQHQNQLKPDHLDLQVARSIDRIFSECLVQSQNELQSVKATVQRMLTM